MTNDLQIHIPTPCHENWDAMTPEAKGRFCSSCAKVVVDFSVMTDNEVLNFLKNNKGSTCGHFTSDQLDRPIIETQLQPKRTWRYWLASIASLFVMLQRSAAQTTSAIKQGKVLVKKPLAKKLTKHTIQQVSTTTGIMAVPIVMGDISIIEPVLPNAIVEGIVLDDNHQPIPFATVTTKAKIGIANTDSLGKFSIDNKYKLDSISLIVSSVGYETKEVSISFKTKTPQVIELKKKALQLPDVTVVSYGSNLKGKIVVGGAVATYRTVSKFDTIPLAIAKVFKNEAFTIYPNPVNKNGIINISVKEAGDYEVQILSNQSKLLYTQQHSTQSLKQVIQLAVPSGAVAGMYYVRLINTATHKQWVDKLMIQ